MRYTLLILGLTLGFYAVFSSGLLYIPQDVLYTFGFSLDSPLTILTYSFVHVGPNHLLGNMVVFFVLGIIAEQRLRGRDFLVVYLLSGAAAALIFALLTPNTVLVGASAAISGLIIPAIFIDFKKTFVYLIITFIAFNALAAPLIATSIAGLQESLSETTTSLQSNITETEGQLNGTYSELALLNGSLGYVGQQYAEGSITEQEYTENVTHINQQIQNLSGTAQNLEEQFQQYSEQYYSVNFSRSNIEEGREQEEAAGTGLFAHFAGVLVGFLYLMRFRRDILRQVASQALWFTRSSKKRRRPSKQRSSKKRSR